MVQCPDSLVWQIVGRNNSFQKKVNGQTKRSGATTFSVEKGNLYSKNSFKFSGLANSKAVDISATADNSTAISTKTKSAATSPKKTLASASAGKCFKRSSGTVKSLVAANYYRRDLAKASLAKYSAVYKANRIAKKEKAAVPMKKGRN